FVERTFGGGNAERGGDTLGQAVEIERGGERPATVGLAAGFAAGFAAEQIDQVEIGCMGQRAAAETAEAEHDQLAALDLSVGAGELFAGSFAGGGKGSFGDTGQAGGDLHRIVPGLDQLHPEGKSLFADDTADAVEAALVIVAGFAALHSRR